MSGRLAPSVASPNGMPLASTSRLRLAPRLARSVGFFPVFFPPEGCLRHAPVHAQPAPVDAAHAIVFQQTALPQGLKHSGGDPLLEAIVRGGAGTELGGIERFPLAAGAQDKENGVHANAIRCTRSAPAEAMSVLVVGQMDFDLTPEVIGDAPVIRHNSSSHSRPSKRVAATWSQVQLHLHVLAICGLFG